MKSKANSSFKKKVNSKLSRLKKGNLESKLKE